jgi:hypothetical protein
MERGCQVNGVRLLPDVYDQRFAFATSATYKTYDGVVFEPVHVCNCIHVYIDLIAMRPSEAFPMGHFFLPMSSVYVNAVIFV